MILLSKGTISSNQPISFVCYNMITGATGTISTGGDIIPDLTDQDDAYATVTLPFDFKFYGTSYNTVYPCTNGFLSFTTPSTEYANQQFPASYISDVICPFWGDLYVGTTGVTEGVYTVTGGTAPYRTFIIRWQAETLDNALPVNFEVVFHETTNDIDIIYGDIILLVYKKLLV